MSKLDLEALELVVQQAISQVIEKVYVPYEPGAVVSCFDSQLGGRIGFYRRLAKKTQCEVAREIGISTLMLSRIESGHVSMSAKQFFKLAEVVNISPTAFDDICSELNPFDGESKNRGIGQ